MEIEDIDTISFEQAKRLKSLGITQDDSHFIYLHDGRRIQYIGSSVYNYYQCHKDEAEICCAFTLEEMNAMIKASKTFMSPRLAASFLIIMQEVGYLNIDQMNARYISYKNPPLENTYL